MKRAHTFLQQLGVKEGLLIAEGEELVHLRDALRLSVGDLVTVSDGAGTLHETQVLRIGKHSMELEILHRTNFPRPAVEYHLYQSLLKGSRMEMAVQKTTEIGIDKIVPIITERTVVRMGEEKSKGRVERWQKMCLEASKQSRRQTVPRVEKIVEFSEVLEKMGDYGLFVVPHETEKERKLTDFKPVGPLSKVAYLIGPEGGLTEAEISSLRERGAWTVTLGSNVLRSETAALVTLAILKSLNFGGG